MNQSMCITLYSSEMKLKWPDKSTISYAMLYFEVKKVQKYFLDLQYIMINYD